MTSRVSTTHDWSASVDHEHLADVRRRARELAPSGVEHLVLEVLAYAAEEAEDRGVGSAVVTLHALGATVADDGRGTATLFDDAGRFVKKPVMATRDLRFFDAPAPPVLADGHARRGMSVVSALSVELTHTNRRLNGSWTQRYAAGVPVTDLVPVPDDGSTGTTVRFVVAPPLGLATHVDVSRLRERIGAFGAQGLVVRVTGRSAPPR
ncbi:ATP-binding protein [Cellulosimicrobium cellulans]|uniref:ATP-binding protein n=1 Tax=Cellulosimicrobium cellulans TaxID=1710 RepID=UPI001AD82417|nr:ATP-binding protein [Cellulosimicrobium cellulans]